MIKKLLVSVLLCFFVFSLGMIAQEKEKMIAKQERKRMKIQAAMAEPEDIIFVDDATGNDKKVQAFILNPFGLLRLTESRSRAQEVTALQSTAMFGLIGVRNLS
jgi:hypothetical protein